MEVHCERSNLHRALAIVKYMEKTGSEINSKSLQILLKGAFTMRRADLVQQLLERSKKLNIALGPFSYAISMVTFGMAGDFEKVRRIKSELEEEGFEDERVLVPAKRGGGGRRPKAKACRLEAYEWRVENRGGRRLRQRTPSRCGDSRAR